MKILMVGVLDRKESTDVQESQAFRDLGHQVIEFNYRTEISQHGYDNTVHKLLGILKHNSFDMAYLCKIDSIEPKVINQMNQFTRSFYIFTDPILTAKEMHAVEYARRATWASATSVEVFNEFKKVNSKSYKIFEGFNPKIFYPIKNCAKEYDVIFVGGATEKRKKIIEGIKNAGIDIKFYGSGWGERNIYLEELNTEYNKSKIILNICQSNIFSNRVMQALGSGGFVLSDFCDDLKDTFEDGDELMLCGTDEFIEKIDYQLKNERMRKAIADEGHKAVRKFTWKRQMARVLNAMRKQL